MSSQIPLPNIQHIIELSIFHSIRGECVARGYLPNVSSYPDDDEGFRAYQEDIKNIVADKGFAIEVFNNSNPKSKGFKKAPRIVIITEDFSESETGLDTTPRYYTNPDGESLREERMPPMLNDFTFNVHVLAETAAQLRVLTGIVAITVPHLEGLPAYLEGYPDEEPFWFLVKKIGSFKVPLASDELIEHIYRFTVPDLLDTGLIKVGDVDIKPIGEITLATESVGDSPEVEEIIIS
jgi:hypothetical protein